MYGWVGVWVYVCMYVCMYKVLFTTVNKMLHRTPDKLYPSSESSATLANAFADSFTNEIKKIRDELTPLSSISDSIVATQLSTVVIWYRTIWMSCFNLLI